MALGCIVFFLSRYMVSGRDFLGLLSYSLDIDR